MNNKQPLLSICIPTWNRSKFLRISLDSFLKQIKDIDINDLELYVSDNCSEDDTPSVCQEFINRGLPLTYSRNEKNLGAASNFVCCMNSARGKYILLLGDDDILKDGAVKMILDNIRGKDYGLVHIHSFANVVDNVVEYTDHSKFIKQISYWFTFMSGNIFRKDIVDHIDYRKYIKSHLLQMPFYITSLLSKKQNLLICQDIIEDGLDSRNNGGYNFYEVFVKNYLTIWKEYLDRGLIDFSLYKWIKKDIFVNFIVIYNKRFFVYKKDIKDDNTEYTGNRAGFKIAGANEILHKYYGGCVYYKLYRFKLIYWLAKKSLKNQIL